MYKYEHNTVVESNIETTFDWFEHEGSFRRLMPPWEVAEEVKADETLEVGSQRIFRFPMGPIKMTWVAEHTAYDPPHHFADKMVKGPFWRWHHDHNISEVNGVTTVTDEVSYQVPFGPLGNLVDRILGGALVRSRVTRMFKARELRLQRDLQQHGKFANQSRKKVLIAGSSGCIGTQLVAFLDTGGHEVWRLVRRPAKVGSQELEWYPDKGEIDASILEGFDVIIHLGGVGIGDKRWNKRRKQMIRDSRVNSTKLLADAISSLENKPECLNGDGAQIAERYSGVRTKRQDNESRDTHLSEVSRYDLEGFHHARRHFHIWNHPSFSDFIRNRNLYSGILKGAHL